MLNGWKNIVSSEAEELHTPIPTKYVPSYQTERKFPFAPATGKIYLGFMDTIEPYDESMFKQILKRNENNRNNKTHSV